MPLDTKLCTVFRKSEWQEVRLDIDATVSPNIVGSMVDMRPWIADQTFDAIWSSHNLEHLDAHDVPMALKEFIRVLIPSGFALITCPDLAEIAPLVAKGRLEQHLYTSPAGPITPLDVLFGHAKAIEAGNVFMRHNTGFTEERLGRVLIEAGFSEARMLKGECYDLWALALMPKCRLDEVRELFRGTGLDFFRDEASAAAPSLP